MPPRKLGPALFALVCIGLALYHRYRPLDATFIGLILLAAVPWFAPWLAPLIFSLKVGGLELNFRDLKAQVDENTKMVKATAAAVLPVVMQPPAAANSEAAKAARASAGNDEFVSHGVPLSPKSDEAGEAEVLANSDPNKGAFGGSAEKGRLQPRGRGHTDAAVERFLPGSCVGGVHRPPAFTRRHRGRLPPAPHLQGTGGHREGRGRRGADRPDCVGILHPRRGSGWPPPGAGPRHAGPLRARALPRLADGAYFRSATRSRTAGSPKTT